MSTLETALRSEAITAALSMDPSRPGVGRLCQELLAEVTGCPITHRAPASILFPPCQIPRPDAPRPSARPASRMSQLTKRVAQLEALLIQGEHP